MSEMKKRLISLLLAAAMLTSISAQAVPAVEEGEAVAPEAELQEIPVAEEREAELQELSETISGSCSKDGQLRWELTPDGTMTISGEGRMTDYNWFVDSPWEYYTGYMKTLVLEEGITHIGDSAFDNCTGFTGELIIPDSVVSIGSTAFYATGFESVVFSKNITSIGVEAFKYCENITGTVILPDSLATLGQQAFPGFAAERFEISKENQHFSTVDGVLYNKEGTTLIQYPCGRKGDITIPHGATKIASYAFEHTHTGGGKLILPDSITDIESYAFWHSDFSGSLVIPNSVTYIGLSAFSDCTGVTDLVLSERLEEIGAQAFQYCRMSSVVIPASVKHIGGAAFNPTDLTDIYFKGNNPKDPDSCPFPSGSTLHYIESTSGWPVDGRYCYIHSVHDLMMWEGLTFGYTPTTTNETRLLTGLECDFDWFLGDTTVYNHDLATLSLGVAMSGYGSDDPTYAEEKDHNIRLAYKSLGFDMDTYESKGYQSEDMNTVATAMACKELENGQTLLAINLRGGSYGLGGWAGNFNVGNTGIHRGFFGAADNAHRTIQNYIKREGLAKDDLRIWLVGYSRSAATAGLLTMILQGSGGFKESQIFAYTFATPNNVAMGEVSMDVPNLFNVVNPMDLVPMVPLPQWNYGKVGTSYHVPLTIQMSAEQKEAFLETFSELSVSEYRTLEQHQLMLAYITELLAQAIPTTRVYEDTLQDIIVDAFSSGGNFEDIKSIVSDELFLGLVTLDELSALAEEKEYDDIVRKLELVIAARWIEYGILDDPITTLLGEALDVFVGAMLEDIVLEEDGMNRQLVDAVTGIIKNGFKSDILLQHWPELYMSWMMTSDEWDLTKTNRYKTLYVRCPVNVAVYNSNNELVAQTTTVTFTGEDGEEYTVPALVKGKTTIEAHVLGNARIFQLDANEEYRVEIISNDTYETGDTMDCTIIEYENGEAVAAVDFVDVGLEEDSSMALEVSPEKQLVEHKISTEAGVEILPSKVRNDADSQQTVLKKMAVERTNDTCVITGSLGCMEQDVIVHYAVYDEKGCMLAVDTQFVAASDVNRDLKCELPLQDDGRFFKVFATDSVSMKPCGDSKDLILW